MEFETFYELFEQWLQSEDVQLRKRFDLSPIQSIVNDKPYMIYANRLQPQREEIVHKNVFEESYESSCIPSDRSEPVQENCNDLYSLLSLDRCYSL